MQAIRSTERPNFDDKVKPCSPSTLKRPHNSSDVSSRKRLASEMVLKIVSATYGPSEGHRLSTGELSSDEANCIPFTRDVAPFLKALLVLRKSHDERDYVDVGHNGVDYGDENSDLVRITGRKRNVIPLMGGRRMNTIFGDPCPGTSKRLRIHYVAYESIDDGTTRASSASEVHRVAFAEHDHVVLRPRLTYYQDEITLRHAVAAAVSDTRNASSIAPGDRQEEGTLLNARTLGRAQSIAEFTESFSGIDLGLGSETVQEDQDISPQPARTWRLRSATSEIALPVVLPFLTVREMVQCKLVCKVWRNLIQYLGVARTIDINDDTTFPNFTLPIFRGLLAHSYHSLQSLFLNGFGELTKDDLHPSIPHLRKLECLDISRCNDLDDSTLILLSKHVASTLEVFYLKGLRNVTDRGMMAIAQSCVKLQVLEISNVPISDESGVGIGQNLQNLRALYMRDNYLLTNKSVDVITEKCTQLSQLTLWGCTRLRHLSFHASSGLTIGCGKLVILNLWGCHSLTDDSASALKAMKYLRSLIVSECQKLTNAFLFGLAECAPQLNHLHLRYCKKITDAGVNEITHSMRRLYSLDLSFCSRITSAAIVNLLELRKDTLTELRVQNCPLLDTSNDLSHRSEPDRDLSGHGEAGHAIFHALCSVGGLSHLSILDLRNCRRHRNVDEGFPCDDAFAKGMLTLRFRQVVPGFFYRPTRPDQALYQDLLDNCLQ